MLEIILRQVWEIINSFMSIEFPIGQYRPTFWNLFYFFTVGGLIMKLLGGVALRRGD